jgi:hypothetical protein
MTIMSEVLDEDAVGEALRRHGVTDLDAAGFIAVFEEVVDSSTETLTAAEREFLIERGGVEPKLLGPQAQAAAQARLVVATERANAQALRGGYTTSQVAQMLGTAAANVRRAVARSGLYTAGRARNREHVFPAWQFHGDRPLPGLVEVLPLIPEDYHPLDVAAFFTTPAESLDGRSPADWLAYGGDEGPVVRLADELSRV